MPHLPSPVAPGYIPCKCIFFFLYWWSVRNKQTFKRSPAVYVAWYIFSKMAAKKVAVLLKLYDHMCSGIKLLIILCTILHRKSKQKRSVLKCVLQLLVIICLLDVLIRSVHSIKYSNKIFMCSWLTEISIQ